MRPDDSIATLPSRALAAPSPMARKPRPNRLESTRIAPAIAPTAPAGSPRRLRQSDAAARLRDPLRDPRVHLHLPAHRPARLRPLHDRRHRRQALRRAQEPEALPLELSQRRRLPRAGDQRHPRRNRRRDEAALRAHLRPTGTCAAASTRASSPSIARRAGSPRPPSSCPTRPTNDVDAAPRRFVGKSAASHRGPASPAAVSVTPRSLQCERFFPDAS